MITRLQSVPKVAVELLLAEPPLLLCKVSCGELHDPHYFWDTPCFCTLYFSSRKNRTQVINTLQIPYRLQIHSLRTVLWSLRERNKKYSNFDIKFLVTKGCCREQCLKMSYIPPCVHFRVPALSRLATVAFLSSDFQLKTEMCSWVLYFGERKSQLGSYRGSKIVHLYRMLIESWKSKGHSFPGVESEVNWCHEKMLKRYCPSPTSS